jgi:Bacterial extracellular solute-binding protein, family 7
VHTPADLKGLRIRVLPSQVQARTFELLGAVPMRMDLTQAIEIQKLVLNYQGGLALSVQPSGYTSWKAIYLTFLYKWCSGP